LPHLTEGAGAKGRDNRDALFRLSVAEYALGKASWIEDMHRSIDYGYVPTHERALLSSEIEKKFAPWTDSDFRTQLNLALQIVPIRDARPAGCAMP
jgi:hypothetical protein